MQKLSELLASRRLWATVFSVAAALSCYRAGVITAEDCGAWVRNALAIYTGAIGVEHAAGLLAKK